MVVCGVKPLSTHSVCLCDNVAMCLSFPMLHIPQLVISQLCYHDCRMGGRCCDDSELGAELKTRSLENRFRVLQMQKMYEANSLWPPRATHFAMLETQNYDSQLLKNKSHLSGRLVLKLQTYTNTHLCDCDDVCWTSVLF